MIWDASIANKIDKWWFIGTPHQKIVIVSIMATGGASLTILVVGTLETPKVNKKNLGKNGRWFKNFRTTKLNQRWLTPGHPRRFTENRKPRFFQCSEPLSSDHSFQYFTEEPHVWGRNLLPILEMVFLPPLQWAYKPLRTWVDEFIPDYMEILGVDRPDRTCADNHWSIRPWLTSLRHLRCQSM